uniref:4F2 cell-surface antigen heavy chain-like n=1 Tax=Lepisosteus oculatus TaxID=7918 RepID=W5M170_LEPOC|nr:PREDICTED: 4F2 cell-surface antigen heavy chain-like [Lepisosteus oculatus]
MEDHINSLSQLKIKGLVLGSLHKAPTDSETDLSLDAVDGSLGTLDNFKSFMSKAQGKGISVVVDLTPNYRGQMPWYSDKFLQDPSQQAKIKGAFDFWLGLGVKGIQVSGLDHLVDKAPALWEELWNKTKWEGSEPADR